MAVEGAAGNGDNDGDGGEDSRPSFRDAFRAKIEPDADDGSDD